MHVSPQGWGKKYDFTKEKKKKIGGEIERKKEKLEGREASRNGMG